MFGAKRRWRVAPIALLFLAMTTGMAGAATGPRLTAPVNATKADVSPGRTYSAPYLAVDPSNKKVIVGGFIEFRSRTCGLVRSTDGGLTWKIAEGSPDLPSYPYCLANNSNIFHAPVAFGRNGTLYLATHAWDTPDSRNKEGIQVARSTDLGDHWTTVIARDARPTSGDTQENDRPITGLIVDTKHGDQDIVYVTFRQNFPNTSAPNSKIQQPAILISRDGGKTFAPPVVMTGSFFSDNKQVVDQGLTTRTTNPATTTTTAAPNTLGANPANPANYGSAGNGQGFAMDDKGNLYYGWMTSSANVTPGVPSAIVLSKSTDQGKSWTTTLVQPPSYQNRQNVRLAWSPEGGANGTLHMVWEGSKTPEVNAFAEPFYSKSTDGGKTWSAPTRISDSDPAHPAGGFLPNVQVAANGRVDIAWWDTRDDPGIRSNDVYYVYSNDNGTTWSKNIRITDQTVDRRFGVWGNNFDQNSPPSLASTNEYAMFAWDDTRLSRGDAGTVQAGDPTTGGGIGTGVQDIFTAAYQFKALGGGTSKVAKGIIAGVIGLLAVGLVLLIIALAQRRSSGGPRKAARSTTKSPATVK